MSSIYIASLQSNPNSIMHNVSFAVVKDGKLDYVCELERFSGIKYDGGNIIPLLAHTISKNYNWNDINNVYFSDDDNNKILTNLAYYRYRQSFRNKKSNRSEHHHLYHALEAYYCSGFKEAAVFVNDGRGSNGDRADCISLYYFKDNDYTLLAHFSDEFSLGLLYENICGFVAQWSGFSEGKLMGLAPYGKDTGLRFIKWDSKNKTLINTLDYKSGKLPIWPYVPNIEGSSTMCYANIAATVQANFDEVVIEMLQYLRELVPSSCRNLCMSGGCFQNCTSNRLICNSGLFDNYYCGPIPHDGGISIGMAFNGLLVNNEPITQDRLTTSYFGHEYSDDEVIKAIEKSDEEFSIIEVDNDAIAQRLEQGFVYAWFDGGSEIGPRALCHRSIIARPDRRHIADIINIKIKHRESWRPFAPVIRDEVFDKIFDEKNHDLFEFMLRTSKIKDEYVASLQGVCHIDQTTRPQRLTEKANPRMYDLLKYLETRCGWVGLINTSFNGKSQPIIETPKLALNMLSKTPLLEGVIFNGHLLVTRK